MVIVVSRTRAENQMETCGVHLDGTLFLPAQGRTPRVPVKAAKGSRPERSQASSFISTRSKQASKLQKPELRLSLHSSGVRRNFCSGVRRNFCLSPKSKNICYKALAGWLSWLECGPVHQKVLCGFHSWLGHIPRL